MKRPLYSFIRRPVLPESISPEVIANLNIWHAINELHRVGNVDDSDSLFRDWCGCQKYADTLLLEQEIYGDY